MIETIVRVARAESVLAASLGGASAAVAGNGARRIRKLVIAKRILARQMLSGAARIRAASRRTPLMNGLKGVKDDFEDSLMFLVAAIEAGIEEAMFAEVLAEHERLKWNNLVLSIASALKKGFPEGVPVLVAAERGKRAVEGFLELSGSRQGLFRLKASSPAWRERLLLVGDLPLEAQYALGQECIVEKANERDAIERLRERYYGAIIAVDGLSDIKATELCARAARVFPGIEERFLHLYGADGGKETRGKGTKARRLPKSSDIADVLEEVGLIINR